MKISITGHSKGIGKACFDLLSKEHNVVGFSRSNGFNIKEPKKIITASIGCDVFINNAYDNFYQVDLIYDLWDLWKSSDTQIVCLGSVSPDTTAVEYNVTAALKIPQRGLCAEN